MTYWKCFKWYTEGTIGLVYVYPIPPRHHGGIVRLISSQYFFCEKAQTSIIYSTSTVYMISKNVMGYGSLVCEIQFVVYKGILPPQHYNNTEAILYALLY